MPRIAAFLRLVLVRTASTDYSGNLMKKLTRDEIKERVEKIRQGLGDDDEVSLWVEEISASIPNCQVIGTIMAGNGISVDEIVDRLYRPDVIYL